MKETQNEHVLDSNFYSQMNSNVCVVQTSAIVFTADTYLNSCVIQVNHLKNIAMETQG